VKVSGYSKNCERVRRAPEVATDIDLGRRPLDRRFDLDFLSLVLLYDLILDCIIVPR
jgi:hypothetical protein